MSTNALKVSEVQLEGLDLPKDLSRKYEDLGRLVVTMVAENPSIEKSELWGRFSTLRTEISSSIRRGAKLAKQRGPEGISIFRTWLLEECIQRANAIGAASQYLVEDCLKAYFSIYQEGQGQDEHSTG